MDISKNSRVVLERRYLKRDDEGNIVESPEGMCERVAKHVAKAELLYGGDEQKAYETFLSLLTELEFIPNSPTLMNAGKGTGQLAGCFVLPVGDSMESIFDAIKYTALIHKSGGGTGFSFSQIRPKNDMVRSTKGAASGPISFMTVFDAATETIKQGGTRRGANMGVLRVDHPDILEFISAKENLDKLNNFNISVALTDEFMARLDDEKPFNLINPKTLKISNVLTAKEIFNLIVEKAWGNGEPGVIFIDEINNKNKLRDLGLIESTNPCGEQPLLPYESCNLGSINLAKMVKTEAMQQVGLQRYLDGLQRYLDEEKLRHTVKNAVWFMDNIIDVNKYPLPEIEELTKANRKIGLGVMGFADLLALLEIAYESEEAIKLAKRCMSIVQQSAIEASMELAKTRGPFPNWDKVADQYKKDQYPNPVRHATETTIAPTGSISIIAGCSSGIEPYYSLVYTRTVLDNDKLVEINPVFEKIAKENGFYSDELVNDLASRKSLDDLDVPSKWKKIFKCAHKISPEQHVLMQAAFQEYTDNAVSKTINFPKTATIEDIKLVYKLAYKSKCKGITVYRDGSRRNQVLECGQQASKEPIITNHKVIPRKRGEVVSGNTRRMTTGCGNLYITINEDEDGLVEVFTVMGKAGGCAASQAEAISRLISLCLRSKIDTNLIIRQLSTVRCPSPAWEKGGGMILSCADAIAKALERHTSQETIKVSSSDLPICPECNEKLEPSGGCFYCLNCGYSRC